MKRRCADKTGHHFLHYSARGIGYDPAWSSFEQFFSDMGECPDGMTLERRDNNLGYNKENCCWLPSSKQHRNTTKNVYVQYEGNRVLLLSLCEKRNINPLVVRKRLGRSWTLAQALGIDPPSARVKSNCAGASGMKGVCFFRPTSKWRAEIFVNGRSKSLGYFATVEEAAAAYENAVRIYFPNDQRRLAAITRSPSYPGMPVA